MRRCFFCDGPSGAALNYFGFGTGCSKKTGKKNRLRVRTTFTGFLILLLIYFTLHLKDGDLKSGPGVLDDFSLLIRISRL
jgi:hypothetical protein